MRFLDKLERPLGRFAIGNITLYLIIGQVFFYLTALLGSSQIERIALIPAKVIAGEYWRVVTFVLIPPNASAVFIAFAWYMFYLMGSALEGYWGTFRYNVFLLIGYLLTVGAAFVFPFAYATNVFLAGSVFLAFAYLNPDFQLMIFFVLPVKIKWLALLNWVIYAYEFIRGGMAERLLILAAVGNFILFFARDIFLSMRSGRRRMAHQAEKWSKEEEPLHRCVVCAKTDLTHPNEDFRYCSKCAGAHAYCQEHLPSHEHILVDPDEVKP